jgi:AcrR family transcriptional regulator
MSGEERRTLILAAARRVFSRNGYDGAKTLQIAREAGVSEALVYRHYPSKLALYRAVLRQIFREQDENWKTLGLPEASTAGVVRTIKNYFYAVVEESHSPMQEGYMLTLASLSADGAFASLLYRRSERRTLKHIAGAHAAAREAGDIVGQRLPVGDTFMFIEHVGTMLNAVCRLAPASRPYASEGTALARDAVWFCCRGIGLTDDAIARYIDAGSTAEG